MGVEGTVLLKIEVDNFLPFKTFKKGISSVSVFIHIIYGSLLKCINHSVFD